MLTPHPPGRYAAESFSSTLRESDSFGIGKGTQEEQNDVGKSVREARQDQGALDTEELGGSTSPQSASADMPTPHPPGRYADTESLGTSGEGDSFSVRKETQEEKNDVDQCKCPVGKSDRDVKQDEGVLNTEGLGESSSPQSASAGMPTPHPPGYAGMESLGISRHVSSNLVHQYLPVTSTFYREGDSSGVQTGEQEEGSAVDQKAQHAMRHRHEHDVTLSYGQPALETVIVKDPAPSSHRYPPSKTK
ncbi:hypothetical protein DXG01_013545, partial [Tephrocybe rancida]